MLDEPTVGLDIESRAAIWSVLRQLRDGGTTVLLSSHYLEEVDALADHLAIIEAGKVIAEGAPAVLKAALGGDRVTFYHLPPTTYHQPPTTYHPPPRPVLRRARVRLNQWWW